MYSTIILSRQPKINRPSRAIQAPIHSRKLKSKPAAISVRHIRAQPPLIPARQTPLQDQVSTVPKTLFAVTLETADFGSKNDISSGVINRSYLAHSETDKPTRRHKNREHLAKFICTGCGKKYGLKADIQQHMNSCHELQSDQGPAQQFECPFANCRDKIFTRNDNLQRHIRLKHSRANLSRPEAY